MTPTEEKNLKVSDVERWTKAVEVGCYEVTGHCFDALACLRDAALLGVQVPGLRADNAALLNLQMDKPAHVFLGACPDDIEGWDSRDPECPACQVLSQPHPGAAMLAEHESKVSALQARVEDLGRANAGVVLESSEQRARAARAEAELQQERATATSLREHIVELRSERDALRAKLEDCRVWIRNMATEHGGIGFPCSLMDDGPVALSTPPAEEKT